MDLHRDKFLTRALAEASTPIFMIDRSSRIVWANDSYCQAVGVSSEDSVGSMAPSFSHFSKDKERNRELWAELTAGRKWIDMMSAVIDGKTIHFQTVITPLPDRRGNTAYFLVIQYDITNQYEESARVWHAAHHDALTGLANRTLFSSMLERIVFSSKRNSQMFAVMFIDLDKFKPVNDTFGHHVGDFMLKHAGDVLRGKVRESDLVSRFGGDEFGVILNSIGKAEDAERIATEMIDELCTPVELEGNMVNIGASIGIAVYPENGLDAEGLLKSADAAMYAAKEAGRNTYRFYQG